MRANLSENPSILVKDDKEYKKIESLASGRKKTLLNESEYKKSVSRAAKLIKSAKNINNSKPE
ncbi:hypothetical protein Q0F97_07925 [Tetragenococcus halophilus]|uniref:hypothetical protein n=1 Tax=Tetragenococcus halophilus TaxID=51669 RepID=UPI0020958D94|nr:hypothetical protein [Tetragenococcus halophilus]MCO7027022.1 hypothetical protein [Tetragenococcus halophilus]